MGYIKLHKNEVCKFARYILVTIILIILLSLALIKVIVKGKFFDCKIKTVEQFHDAIWNNAHEFIFFDRPDFSCSENKLLYSV